MSRRVNGAADGGGRDSRPARGIAERESSPRGKATARQPAPRRSSSSRSSAIRCRSRRRCSTRCARISPSGGQSVVFLNRRGFHNFLQCHLCGIVIACPNCSVSMTFHMRDRSLRCHWCGKRTRRARSLSRVQRLRPEGPGLRHRAANGGAGRELMPTRESSGWTATPAGGARCADAGRALARAARSTCWSARR